MLLSLAGIPMTLGFIAKFYLFAAGVDGALWVLLWALIVGSGIGLFYYLRIIFAMTRQHDERGDRQRTGGLAGRPQRDRCVDACLLVYGIYPMPLIDAAREAVATFGTAARTMIVGP